MVQKPVVFISSTSDLRSARDLVGKVLHSMGYEPVWQDIEPTDGGELLDVLRDRMHEPAGLQRMVSLSVAVHVALFAALFFAPGIWPGRSTEPPATVMTITLGGGNGPPRA